MKLVSTLSLASAPVLALAIASLAGPASAQATRTWVSGVGDDVNPCSRTAPCKTFAGAISKTAAGGEISVLDPGGFGTVTITKSISLYCENSGEGSILSSGVNGIIINAGANDVINLRGLAIEGAGTGLNGVQILSAGEVHIQDMLIRNFHGSTTSAGVNVVPTVNPVKVTINNTTIANAGSPTGGAGVLVRPTGSATTTATVTVANSELTGNTAGVKADGAGGAGPIKVMVTDSVSSSNVGQGFFAQSAAGATVNMVLNGVTGANNGSFGSRTDGANATLIVGRSTFSGNGAAGMGLVNGGVLKSYRDNHSDGLNAVADSPTVQVFPN